LNSDAKFKRTRHGPYGEENLATTIPFYFIAPSKDHGELDDQTSLGVLRTVVLFVDIVVAHNNTAYATAKDAGNLP
jgi:hypothetical protein